MEPIGSACGRLLKTTHRYGNLPSKEFELLSIFLQLDIELSSVHKNLLHRNFLRVMSAQVSIVVKLLRECVTENVGMEPAFYHRLFEAWHVLVEFFHAGGKGLSMDALDTNPEHMVCCRQF